MSHGRRGLAVLGATGSVGRATLAVLRRRPERFRLVALTAHRAAAALDELAAEFEPDVAVLSGGRPRGHELAWSGGWRFGREALLEVAADPASCVVVNALVGTAGLEPTLAALRAGKRVALANKESLVAGGEHVLAALREGGGELVPVDSEHSAVHRCLAGRSLEDVRRVLLTASGGPFRTTPAERFAEITPAEALAHPTWQMGRKITVDSATLANKALEVIEAHHLFGVDYGRIDVVVHPQSIVHSLVEFTDGSVLAQMEEPDMEGPVAYALHFPERVAAERPPFDPVATSPLTFEPLRREDFPMFDLGVAAGRRGRATPAVYNAANEVAVAAFLDGRLDFPGIPAVVEAVLADLETAPAESVEELLDADRGARDRARERVRERRAGAVVRDAR